MNFRSMTTASIIAFLAPMVAQAEDLKIGYINKMGDHPWFVAEVGGAAAAAAAGGADFVSQDVQFNADLTITTLDTMIGDGVDGIAIVVPDRALGPVVAARAKEAGIPLIAVDDGITFEDGSPVPYVGMDAHNIGLNVGRELAAIYDSEGWADKKVAVLSIEDRRVDSCMDRNRGAEEALLGAVDGLDESNVIRVSYDNTMVNAIDVMTTTLTGNPQFDNWIFYSCNDDGVLGAARAMENAGYPADQGIGIGIDGSRSCGLFGQGKASAFRGTMWLRSTDHGRVAVELLLAAIRDGSEIPMTTYTNPVYLTEDNFAEHSADLCG